jgi:hypothetical protein
MKGAGSMKKILLMILGMFFVLALGMGQAQAASWTLELTGDMQNAGTYNFNSGDRNYSGWSLNLDEFTTFSASQGDQVNATITLNKSVTMPASVYNTSVELALYGDSNPGYDTSTFSTTTFYYDGTEGSTFTQGSSSADWLFAGATLFGPDNSFTFDKILINYSINKIGDGNSLVLTHAMLTTQLQNPAAVPIPAAVWLLGSGLVGLLGFKRKLNK